MTFKKLKELIARLQNDKRYQTGVMEQGKLNYVFYMIEDELNSIEVLLKELEVMKNINEKYYKTMKQIDYTRYRKER